MKKIETIVALLVCALAVSGAAYATLDPCASCEAQAGDICGFQDKKYLVEHMYIGGIIPSQKCDVWCGEKSVLDDPDYTSVCIGCGEGQCGDFGDPE